jgi:hypothetical protein
MERLTNGAVYRRMTNKKRFRPKANQNKGMKYGAMFYAFIIVRSIEIVSNFLSLKIT